MPHDSPFVIVQLSDLHLFAHSEQQLLGLNTAASLEVIVEAVQHLSPYPQLLLLTGDLAQDETPAAYQMLMACLAPLQIPTYWLPGNHDNPAIMATLLNQAPFSAQKNPHFGDWQFLLLDSSIPGQVHGALSPQTLDWLDQQLHQAHPHPTLVALHHPPLAIQSAWLDRLGLHQPDAFVDLIQRHRHVKLVLFGHIHQQFEYHQAGVAYLSCPSTCVQFAPRQQEFTIDDIQPGFRLLRLYANGTFETEVHRVEIHQSLDLSAQGY